MLLKEATLRKAAEDGDPDAEYRVGEMQIKGLGVLKNHAEAMDLLENSAKQKYPPAEKLLAQLKLE